MFGIKETKIKVGGMMCDHCSMTVKKIVENLEGVKSASVNLPNGEVTIKHKGDLNLVLLKENLAKADYSFDGVIA